MKVSLLQGADGMEEAGTHKLGTNLSSPLELVEPSVELGRGGSEALFYLPVTLTGNWRRGLERRRGSPGTPGSRARVGGDTAGTWPPSHSQAPQQLGGILVLGAAGVPCVPAPLLQQQPVLDVHVQHILVGHLRTQGHRRKGGTSEGAAGAPRHPLPAWGAPTSRSL